MRSDFATDKRRGGFTLVEIALALLVVALGVVGIFALFPQALDASRRSVNATEVSAFADFVLDGLQIEAEPEVNQVVWNDFRNNNAPWNGDLYLNPSHVWSAVGTTQALVEADGYQSQALSPRVYSWIPSSYGEAGGGSGSGGADALFVMKYAAAQFTYTLHVTNDQNRIFARLQVWAGDRLTAVQNTIGASTNLPDSYVFYREYVPAF